MKKSYSWNYLEPSALWYNSAVMDLSRLFRFLSLPVSLAAVCALAVSTTLGATADLQSFSNVRLVPNSYNDGDS